MQKRSTRLIRVALFLLLCGACIATVVCGALSYCAARRTVTELIAPYAEYVEIETTRLSCLSIIDNKIKVCWHVRLRALEDIGAYHVVEVDLVGNYRGTNSRGVEYLLRETALSNGDDSVKTHLPEN